MVIIAHQQAGLDRLTFISLCYSNWVTIMLSVSVGMTP